MPNDLRIWLDEDEAGPRRGDICPVCGDVRTGCCDVIPDLVASINAFLDITAKDYLSERRRAVFIQAEAALKRARGRADGHQ